MDDEMTGTGKRKSVRFSLPIDRWACLYEPLLDRAYEKEEELFGEQLAEQFRQKLFIACGKFFACVHLGRPIDAEDTDAYEQNTEEVDDTPF